MLSLYKNIAFLRKKHKLTQDALGMKLGYSKSMISKIENGEVDLQVSRIIQFANAFGVKPGELLGWEEDLDELTEPLFVDDKHEYEEFMKHVRGASDEELHTAAKILDVVREKSK